MKSILFKNKSTLELTDTEFNILLGMIRKEKYSIDLYIIETKEQGTKTIIVNEIVYIK